MSRTTLTNINAGAKIQRCAIANPFEHYKPESERSIKKFEVKENEIINQLKSKFKRYHDKEDYDGTRSLVRNLKISSKDVTDFSIALAEMQNEDDFERKAGFFLSVLVNKCPEDEVMIIINHLERVPDYIGYKNTKQTTIKGNVGDLFGGHNTGILVVNGRTGKMCGFCNEGIIHINGIIGSLDANLGLGSIFNHGMRIVEDGVKYD